jgi:hypothetical protein
MWQLCIEGQLMKSIRVLAVLLAVVVAAVLASPATTSAAAKTKVVSFKSSYTGTASLLIDSSSVKILSVAGNGSASLIGAGSISGTGNGTGASGLCVPFTGKGAIKGSSGSIKFSVNASKSQGCSSGQSGPVTVTVTGVAKVTGGSGSAKGAKGNLRFTGTLKLNDTTGAQSGTFSGTLSGKLTVNK